MSATDVIIQAKGKSMDGYFAQPDGEGPWPGVVVIHDAFGLTADTRRWVDRFAAEGFMSVGPDLFSTGPTPVCVMATFRAMFMGKGYAFQQIEESREFLVAKPDCTRKVGIIGFCMGGGFALLTAPRGFDVSAPKYGQLPLKAEKALQGACPVVASFGKKDLTLKGAAKKLEKTLTTLGVEHDVKEYPDVGHSFMNNHDPGFGRSVVERMPGFGYDEAASEDAFARTTAFFRAHLAT